MKQRDMTPRPLPAMPGTAPDAWPVPDAQPVQPVQPLQPLQALEPQLAVPVPVPPAGDPGAQAVPPRSLPLPQGGAMRRMALDLLYQNGRTQAAPGVGDHVDVPPPPPPRRPWRERRLGRLLPAVEGEDDGLETDIEDWLMPEPAAVVAETFLQPLRPPRMARPGSLPALRPKSRADCERRCGSDGFCDPSDPLGCGGVHCGRR